MAFSVVNPESFENIKTKWLPEIHKFYPDAPIMWLGLKSDLRNNEDVMTKLRSYRGKDWTPPSEASLKKAARELNCQYVECSAMTDADSVHNVLETMLRTVAARSAEVRNACTENESSKSASVWSRIKAVLTGPGSGALGGSRKQRQSSGPTKQPFLPEIDTSKIARAKTLTIKLMDDNQFADSITPGKKL